MHLSSRLSSSRRQMKGLRAVLLECFQPEVSMMQIEERVGSRLVQARTSLAVTGRGYNRLIEWVISPGGYSLGGVSGRGNLLRTSALE